MLQHKLVEFFIPNGDKICLNVSHIVSVYRIKDDITGISVCSGSDEYWEIKGSYEEVKYHLQLQHVEIWELPKTEVVNR